MTNVNTILNQMRREKDDRLKKAKSERTGLALRISQAGWHIVEVEFSGSGDSGQIDYISVTKEDGESFTFFDGNKDLSEDESNLLEDISDWTYDYLSGTGVDWYNNDGGQGTVEFDVSTVPFSFFCSIDQNETTSETVYTAEEVA